MNMLRRVEPYITWGTPNLKSVKELIYKRGYGKVRAVIIDDRWMLCRVSGMIYLRCSASVLCAGEQEPHPSDGQRRHRGGAPAVLALCLVLRLAC